MAAAATSYTIGIDYGTNSVRAVVVGCADGRVAGAHVFEYPSGDHGVLLRAGDPHLANADDGCVVKVPRGKYVVEGIGLAWGRDRIVSRLRVRLEGAKNLKPGKEVGDTGTDSAMIGVCDSKAFDKAIGPDAGEEVQEAI